jgi:flagellar biogenesis protein FliO
MATNGTTIQCDGACTVTLQFDPVAAGSEQYQAAIGIFAALLTAAAVIWGVKRLVRLFDSAPE